MDLILIVLLLGIWAVAITMTYACLASVEPSHLLMKADAWRASTPRATIMRAGAVVVGRTKPEGSRSPMPGDAPPRCFPCDFRRDGVSGRPLRIGTLASL